MLDRIPERLRTAAEGVSAATKFLADRKSARNQAAGDAGSCYRGVEPEQTAEWQAAELIERMTKALEPFAKIADEYEAARVRSEKRHRDELGPDYNIIPRSDSHRVSIGLGDCRAARSALGELVRAK